MSRHFPRPIGAVILAGCLWQAAVCQAQESKAPPNTLTKATDEDSFVELWAFGWREGLLPIPAELIGELGLSEGQMSEIRTIIGQYPADPKLFEAKIKRYQSIWWDLNSDLEGSKSAKREMQQLGITEQELNSALRDRRYKRTPGQVLAEVRNDTRNAIGKIWTKDQRAVFDRRKASPVDLGPKPRGSVVTGDEKSQQPPRLVVVDRGDASGALLKSPDGKLTVVIDPTKNSEACWMSDAATGERVGPVLLHGKKGQETGAPLRVTCWAFSPDGKLLATSAGYSNLAGYTEGVVSIWDVASGKLVASAFGGICKVKAVAFSKDSKTVYFECLEPIKRTKRR